MSLLFFELILAQLIKSWFSIHYIAMTRIFFFLATYLNPHGRAMQSS